MEKLTIWPIDQSAFMFQRSVLLILLRQYYSRGSQARSTSNLRFSEDRCLHREMRQYQKRICRMR